MAPPRKPKLTVEMILRWADGHRRRTGGWPTAASGPVAGARGESWHGINLALGRGFRGLPPGGSLARLLDRERGSQRARAEVEGPRWNASRR